MGIGAIVTLGEGNAPMDGDLLGAILEIRVEQPLDGPARYAVRFGGDIVDGRLSVADDPRLAVGTIVAVLVEVGNGDLECLVRGPITDHRLKTVFGGPGSSFDIVGLDRLDLLDRTCVRAAWTGRASEVATAILGATFERTNVGQTARVFEEGASTLNQRSTDLDFLMQIARRNNLHLWVSYAAQRSGLGGYAITETANLAISPPGASGALGLISLVPTSPLELRVHVPSAERTVTAFEVAIDSRRPAQFRGGSMSREDGRTQTTQTADPQPPSGDGPVRLAQIGGAGRDLCMVGSGDPTETQGRAEAALADAGWFVQASASTSTELLDGILRPHDVVQAVGIGPRFGRAAFRVREATHVVTRVATMSDLKLESNSLGD